MAGLIYHLKGNSELVPMQETTYESEKLLQELLAKYPDLLAGEQINCEKPRRWLLVTREMYVPDENNGTARWSLDHLFIDQDAVPTLVEVKRSSDTRIRREVIGQMLDYAAHAVAYWPVEEIKAKFEARCKLDGLEPTEVLLSHLDKGQNPDEFWQRVKTNLQAGKVRLVFIADSIPSELRRVVEFLNEQMDPAEVLAIEVKQFLGQGEKTLVPRVLGQTETARQKKSPGTKAGIDWNEDLFMKALSDKGDAVCTAAKDLLDWLRPRVTAIEWGQGGEEGTITPTIDREGVRHVVGRLNTNGWFAFRFDWLRKKPPFADESLRRELLTKINEVSSQHFGDESLSKIVKVPFETLSDLTPREKLKAAINWQIQQLSK